MSRKGKPIDQDAKILVRQVKSTNGCTAVQQACVRGLGLRRMHQTVLLEDTPSIRGMVNKVKHLVTVEIDRDFKLFEEKERIFTGPKDYIETDFEYLDRSARPEAAAVREFMNDWLSKYPQDEAAELISRLKSREQNSFDGAAFEIALYAILIQLGCEIEVHPELPNGSKKRPDFLVKTPDGEDFYLEATLASEFDTQQIGAERRKNIILQSISKLDSPNFFLGIKAESNPNTPPPSKALRKALSAWLASLDPDEVIGEITAKGYEFVPTLDWQHEGWKVEFEAIPIKPERRGKGQRVIGTLSGGVRWSNIWESIRDAIRSKGGRYGELDKPFVVAVNVQGHKLDRIDEMQALFGQEEFVFQTGALESGPRFRRANNGAWNGATGPEYTRVSGAWLFGDLNPWNIISRKNTLYFNPWAKSAVPNVMKSINHAFPDNGEMRRIDGESLSRILHLPNSWPE